MSWLVFYPTAENSDVCSPTTFPEPPPHAVSLSCAQPQAIPRAGGEGDKLLSGNAEAHVPLAKYVTYSYRQRSEAGAGVLKAAVASSG